VYIYVIHKDFEKLVQINAKDLNIVLKNVLVNFFMPRGMIVQANKPDLIFNADLWKSLSAILICLKPNCKSSGENH
jgi:hypothetical protein